MLAQTDARIQAVSETMNIIRMVKLFGWENRMAEKLKEKREEELKLVWKLYSLNCVSSMIGLVLHWFCELLICLTDRILVTRFQPSLSL